MRKSNEGIETLKRRLEVLKKQAEKKGLTEDLYTKIEEVKDGIRLLERGL